MTTAIKARKPYVPDCGDLICCESAQEYLETPPKKLPREGQVFPLPVVYPNPWDTLKFLGVDTSEIKCVYKCPYTNYEHYGLVPVALVSTDLAQKYASAVGRPGGSASYWFDHEYHRSMWGDKLFDLSDIGNILLGSGYTSCTHISDGSGAKLQTRINLSNDDYLWVYFWEWYNK